MSLFIGQHNQACQGLLGDPEKFSRWPHPFLRSTQGSRENMASSGMSSSNVC